MARRKGLLLVVGSVILCAGVLVAYVAGVPPFEKRESISASQVCGLYGKDREQAAELIARVTPKAEEYSVRVHGFPRNRNDYLSSCFINSFKMDADLTEVGKEETSSGAVPERSPREWLRDVIRPDLTEAEMGRTRFRAGEWGVAGARMAAIYVPCVPPGHGDPWFHYLTVLVEAKDEPPSSEEESRQAMAELAVLTARHAHEDAKCSLPSKLPKRAPRLGDGH